MLEVTKTENVATDNGLYPTSSLPPNIQQIVALIDEWRMQEANAAANLQMVRSAIDAARNSLLKAMIELETTSEPDPVPDTSADTVE
jgi:hypothetical protein